MLYVKGTSGEWFVLTIERACASYTCSCTVGGSPRYSRCVVAQGLGGLATARGKVPSLARRRRLDRLRALRETRSGPRKATLAMDLERLRDKCERLQWSIGDI